MFLTTVFLALWAFIKSLLCCSSAPEVDEEKAIDTTFQVVVDGGNLARVKRAHLRAERANLYLAPPRPPFYRYGDAPLPSVPPPPPVAFPVRAAVSPNLAGGLPPTAHLKTGCEPRAAANPPAPAPATTTKSADEPAVKSDATSLALVVWRRPLSASDFGVAPAVREVCSGGNIPAEQEHTEDPVLQINTLGLECQSPPPAAIEPTMSGEEKAVDFDGMNINKTIHEVVIIMTCVAVPEDKEEELAGQLDPASITNSEDTTKLEIEDEKATKNEKRNELEDDEQSQSLQIGAREKKDTIENQDQNQKQHRQHDQHQPERKNQKQQSQQQQPPQQRQPQKHEPQQQQQQPHNEQQQPSGTATDTATGNGVADTEDTVRPVAWYLANRELSDSERLQIVLQVAEALTAIHQRGEVYGALRMENLLVEKREEGCMVVLVETSEGNEEYAGWTAPEVMDSAPPTPASDVHSLGLLLLAIWTGLDLVGRARGILRSQGESARHAEELADELVLAGPGELWRLARPRLFEGGWGGKFWLFIEAMCALRPRHRPSAAFLASRLGLFVRNHRHLPNFDRGWPFLGGPAADTEGIYVVDAPLYAPDDEDDDHTPR